MSIPEELAARMPLSYVHFTHFLVDSLLLLAPFALYPKTGAFSIFITGERNSNNTNKKKNPKKKKKKKKGVTHI